MLRLAPSHPPLWRTASSLRLGADARTQLDDVTVWQEQLLDALVDGIPDAVLVPLATAYGADPAEVPGFIDRLGDALCPQRPAPLRVRVEVPGDLDAQARDALLGALESSDIEVESVAGWEPDTLDAALPVVTVAAHLVDPRRAARLMAADITHLPVLLAGDRVTVGPLVVPGQTACLACLHAHRTDDDPDWPLLAAQLLARPTADTARPLLIEAGLLAARLLRDTDAAPTRSVLVSAVTGRRRWHAHRVHPRCPCRSLEGIATADGAFPRSTAPTTPTASAPRG